MGPLIIQKIVEYYLNGPKLVVLSLSTIYYNAPIEKGPLTLNIHVSLNVNRIRKNKKKFSVIDNLVI
jgi:hypothetical protein